MPSFLSQLLSSLSVCLSRSVSGGPLGLLGIDMICDIITLSVLLIITFINLLFFLCFSGTFFSLILLHGPSFTFVSSSVGVISCGVLS